MISKGDAETKERELRHRSPSFRGTCPGCKLGVYSNQERTKSNTSGYWHDHCRADHLAGGGGGGGGGGRGGGGGGSIDVYGVRVGIGGDGARAAAGGGAAGAAGAVIPPPPPDYLGARPAL